MSPLPRETSVQVAAARPTAVIARRTTWAEYPGLWRPLLDEVYAVPARNGEPAAWPLPMIAQAHSRARGFCVSLRGSRRRSRCAGMDG